MENIQELKTRTATCIGKRGGGKKTKTFFGLSLQLVWMKTVNDSKDLLTRCT
jgi:hypothetical protein